MLRSHGSRPNTKWNLEKEKVQVVSMFDPPIPKEVTFLMILNAGPTVIVTSHIISLESLPFNLILNSIVTLINLWIMFCVKQIMSGREKKLNLAYILLVCNNWKIETWLEQNCYCRKCWDFSLMLVKLSQARKATGAGGGAGGAGGYKM